MKDSILYKYLLESDFLCCDESERNTIFSDSILKQEEKFKEFLNEKQMKELFHYKNYIVGHMFHIRNRECFKMLYLGIKLGMEVSDFFHAENEEG